MTKTTDSKHKYTQPERKKVYKLRPQKVKKVHKCLPKSRRERRNIIKSHYKEVYGQYYCPALDANVSINKDISCNKTFYEASMRRKSTQLALVVEELLPIAVKLYDSTAKENEMQAGFVRMHVLVAGVKGVGYAKITVGEYSRINTPAPFCQYSVSHLSVVQLKNKK